MANGSTVTLSEVSDIVVEVDVFETRLNYNLGCYVIEYTETDDLTMGVGTCNGETVIDLYYGPYIVVSGMGNCSQMVMLGTYDWGTFTFSGTASSDGGDGGNDSDDEVEDGDEVEEDTDDVVYEMISSISGDNSLIL